MWVRICALVFMFISRLRFPADSSIADIIRNRYGNVTLKLLRKLEKLDMKYRKTLIDVENGVIPHFLYFKLANRNLRSSAAYMKCQLHLLYQEIKIKKTQSTRALKDVNDTKSCLHSQVRLVDFAHICSYVL